MEVCHELYEYSYLIEQVRIGTRSGLALPDAIEQAVIHCIEHDILKSFLLHHRAEVTNMILKEFNLEQHIQSEKAYSFAEGQETERKRFSQLTQCLVHDARNEDIAKAAVDSDFCLRLYKEYNLL